MGRLKIPSEGGSGGKRGHSNMEHAVFTAETKDAARARRRLDDRREETRRNDDDARRYAADELPFRRHMTATTTSMTQDEIRAYLAADPAVRVTVAAEGDGSPAIARGDTFIYACGERGEPNKMPFVTIVTKDYDGFDEESKLNRGDLYRLNIEVGKAKFQELFGFAPKELDAHRAAHDFAALDTLFPHPVYGAHGWASIIHPGEASRDAVTALLDFARDRALGRAR